MKVDRSTLQLPVVMFLIFFSLATFLFVSTGIIFYVYNFCYIGLSLSITVFLFKAVPREKQQVVRRIAQTLIGGYLLVYVGLILNENLQIEGFFVYILSGVFTGATIHYLIAKILGTFIFNRGWCGWACWSAMLFDVLPWKKPRYPLNFKFTLFRYLHFILSSSLIISLIYIYNFRSDLLNRSSELIWLIIGNLIYYFLGIALALIFKDNRAFCKYLCPIPVLQKIGSRFSLLKLQIDKNKCVKCSC